MPQHADSVYLHPETMKCCGVAIAQPVAIRNAAEGVSVVVNSLVPRPANFLVALLIPVDSINVGHGQGTRLSFLIIKMTAPSNNGCITVSHEYIQAMRCMFSAPSQAIVVCKPWPVAKMELDGW